MEQGKLLDSTMLIPDSWPHTPHPIRMLMLVLGLTGESIPDPGADLQLDFEGLQMSMATECRDRALSESLDQRM
jgi:hypothetical protein